MDRLLIAPSVSPISIALVVPIACEEVPIATPFAIGSVILNSLHTLSAMTFPITPVTIMTATVTDTYPPSSSDTPIPTAVVIDFGRSVTYSVWFNLSNTEKARTLKRLVKTPLEIPKTIAVLFFSTIQTFRKEELQGKR